MKKVFLFLVLLTFLLVLKEVKATIIFSDGFESGFIVEHEGSWTEITTSDGGTIVTSQTQTNSGSWSAFTDTNMAGGAKAYVKKDITIGDTRYLRFYIYFDSLTTNAWAYRLGGIRWYGAQLAAIGLNTNNYLTLRYEDASYNDITVASNIQLTTGQWYSIQIKHYKHDTNGEIKVWLNGLELTDLTQTGINTAGRPLTNNVYVGPNYDYKGITAYYDDVVVADEYIDEVGATTSSTTLTTTTVTITESTTETTTETTTTTPPGQVTLSGELNNSSGIVDALVTLFNPGTSQVNKSESTVNGIYSMDIWPGVYDLQYNIYDIPNFFIKLLSLSISSNLPDVVDNVDSLSNGISFEVNISEDKEIRVYSENEPLTVKANGIELTKVSSSPVTNEWYYTSGEIRMIVGLTLPTTTTTTTTTTLTTESTTTTPPTSADYTITGDGVTYTGVDNNDPDRSPATGSNFVTVLSTVIDWMSPGQRLELVGTFTWEKSYSLYKSIEMDLTQATISFQNPDGRYSMQIYSKVTIRGGHIVNVHDPSQEVRPTTGKLIGTLDNRCILFVTGSSYSVVDGLEFENFGIVFGFSGGDFDHLTIRNCRFHSRNVTSADSDSYIGGGSKGYHVIEDCRFEAPNTVQYQQTMQNIYFEGTNTDCIIRRCEFDNTYGHAMYLSGGSGTPDELGGGYKIYDNIFHNFIFKDNRAHGDIHVKCGLSTHPPYEPTEIYNNTFENYINYCTAISLYSDFTYTTANDVRIHNNTFKNCTFAVWLGQLQETQPALRNLIYNNVFDNCGKNYAYPAVFYFPGWGSIQPTEDTKIYYNDFKNCGTIFRAADDNLVRNTVFAYNYFDADVPADQQTEIQNWGDASSRSMIYQNTHFPPDSSLAMENFNFNGITDPSSWYYVAPR